MDLLNFNFNKAETWSAFLKVGYSAPKERIEECGERGGAENKFRKGAIRDSHHINVFHNDFNVFYCHKKSFRPFLKCPLLCFSFLGKKTKVTKWIFKNFVHKIFVFSVNRGRSNRLAITSSCRNNDLIFEKIYRRNCH